MNDDSDRPAFLSPAAIISVFCFGLAGVFGWTQIEKRWFLVAASLFVGSTMAMIAITGAWPRKR